MATFEQIVRPFQQPNTLNQKLGIQTVFQPAPETPVISWGQKGAGPKTFGLSFKLQAATDSGGTGKFTEVERTVTPVRVENPDDPSQYVVAQRLDKTVFAQQNPAEPAQPPVTTSQNSGNDATYNPAGSNSAPNDPSPPGQPAVPSQSSFGLNTNASPSENSTVDGPQQTITNSDAGAGE